MTRMRGLALAAVLAAALAGAAQGQTEGEAPRRGAGADGRGRAGPIWRC
jgi:hypothetical protein